MSSFNPIVVNTLDKDIQGAVQFSELDRPFGGNNPQERKCLRQKLERLVKQGMEHDQAVAQLHEEMREKAKPFGCSYCDARFRTLIARRMHVEERHG